MQSCQVGYCCAVLKCDVNLHDVTSQMLWLQCSTIRAAYWFPTGHRMELQPGYHPLLDIARTIDTAATGLFATAKSIIRVTVKREACLEALSVQIA